MLRSPVRLRDDDAELARCVAAGDGLAFATLDDRYRKALSRYARTLLRRSEHDAEDIVQDVLICAHDTLRAGDLPDELRPWLYRLTRNRAINEVRRARWGDEALDSEAIGARGEREEPDAVLRRKESVRRLVEDLADLPVSQRTALLARELDGQTPQQVAEQLGVSVAAARMLATRARTNLIKTRDARDADCADVRAVLLQAHERGVRASEHALRHLTGCDPCSAYQRDIRRLSKQLHALNPLFGLPLIGGLAQIAVGGTKTAAVSATLAVAVVASGGIVVLNSAVHQPGDPAPFTLSVIRDSQGRVVKQGGAIPEGFTIVSARIRLPAGPSTMPRNSRDPYPAVTLPCPAGMRLDGLQMPHRSLPPSLRAVGFSADSIPGHSTSAQIKLGHHGLKRAFDMTVAIDCRRPDANGSISTNPRKLKPGERLAHVCNVRRGALLRSSPDGKPQGYVERGAPVAIQRRDASGAWTRVASDGKLAIPGWIKTSALCP